jgi:hypothetical protein
VSDQALMGASFLVKISHSRTAKMRQVSDLPARPIKVPLTDRKRSLRWRPAPPSQGPHEETPTPAIVLEMLHAAHTSHPIDMLVDHVLTQNRMPCGSEQLQLT